MDEQIEKIQLHRRNAVARGIIGLGIGLCPLPPSFQAKC